MQSPRFHEIVFLDDFFRSAANGLGATPANRRFLRAFFESNCRRIGIPVREEFAQAEGGAIPVDLLMPKLGLERSVSGWSASGIADLGQAIADLHPLNLGPGTLVVGWGLPPSLLRHVDAQGASFVDIEIDPLRFARHLFFCARSNDAQIQGVLEAMQVSREVFWSAAASVKAYFARRGVSRLVQPSASAGLFAGQTEVDLALVQEGVLVRPMDYADQIAAWAAEVDVLLVKQHPYASGTGRLGELVRGIPNALMVDHNIYGMFCAENLRFVAALSSGSLREAEYFGVESRSLMLSDRVNADKLPASCSGWVTVGPQFGSMQALNLIVRPPSAWGRWFGRKRVEDFSFGADALDRIFGDRWGLDANSPGLPDCTAVHLGGLHEFAEGSDAVAWLSSGWHAPEAWGVWSGEARCRLIIPLPPRGLPATGTFRVVLRGHFLEGDGCAACLIAIDIDGLRQRPVHGIIGGTPGLSVDIDAQRWAGRALTILTLHISGAMRPIDIGGHPDHRELGFGLTGLELMRVADEEAVADPSGESLLEA